MNKLLAELMKIMKFSYIENENKINYETYYFNGMPIPVNIKAVEIRDEEITLIWELNESIKTINLKNENNLKYIIEIKQSGTNNKEIFECDKKEYTVNNLNINTKYEFRLCCIYNSCMGTFSEILEVKTNEKETIKWKCGPNCIMSNGNKFAKKIGSDRNWDCTIIGDKPLKKNRISKWKVKIKNSYNNNIMIGIAKKENNINNQRTHWGGQAWSLFCYDGYKFFGQSDSSYIKKDIKVNLLLASLGVSFDPWEVDEIKDEIEIICDTSKRTLCFKINGKDYGIAYDNLPSSTDFVPFDELYRVNDEVEFID